MTLGRASRIFTEVRGGSVRATSSWARLTGTLHRSLARSSPIRGLIGPCCALHGVSTRHNVTTLINKGLLAFSIRNMWVGCDGSESRRTLVVIDL